VFIKYQAEINSDGNGGTSRRAEDRVPSLGMEEHRGEQKLECRVWE
jgi:hypothetical protein